MSDPQTHLSGNVKRFSGLASVYDRNLPAPPDALADVLTEWASIGRPRLVVDLGCGTGLSTRYWAGRADQVIGMDLSEEMLAEAVKQTDAGNVSYRPAPSHRTGLDDGCADVVTCSQALHWMEPGATFAEAARILRPGGVFAAYDCDWPPTTAHWEADAAYVALMERMTPLIQEHGIEGRLRRWRKSGHLDRMRASGRFRFVKEILLHHEEMGNAERLIGLVLSQGGIGDLLKLGLSESEIGLDVFRAEAKRTLGDDPRPCRFCYRVRAGII